jgi:CRISPR-associated endoribonuclease Cas6
MRLRLDVYTTATSIPWPAVLAPGRALAYSLLHRSAPQLGATLRANGYGQHRVVPFGYGAPIFQAAPAQRGVYTAGGKGTIELGSPLPEITDAWLAALARWPVIDWGGVRLEVDDVHQVEPPGLDAGQATMRTETPVVLKTAGGDARSPWLLPGEPGWAEHLVVNLGRKTDTLVLPDVTLRRVTWVGHKRTFVVGSAGQGLRPGAPAEVALADDPRSLQAIWSWGLGQSNSAGFGWIRDDRS